MERTRKIGAMWRARRWIVCLVAGAGVMMMPWRQSSAKPPIKLFDAGQDERSTQDGGDEQGEGGEQAQQQEGPVIRYGKQGASRPGDSDASSSASPGKERVIRPVVHQVGASTLVEVKVGGHEALMLLDTGATYTTITPWFAEKIGAKPPVGGPSSTFRTANGELVAPFGSIASFSLGGVQVGPTTFSLCESCGEENLGGERAKKVVGLLGMNVLGRYRMQMEGGVLELVEGRGHENRRVDVKPWVELVSVTLKDGLREAKNQSAWELSVKIANQSKHTIKDARFGILCKTRAGVVVLEVEAQRLASRESYSTTLTLEQEPLDCASGGLEVIEAKW